MNPNCFFDVWPTSLAAAQANILASSRAQAALLNENLKTIYLGKFNDWKISVDAGKIDNSNPPQPPASYVISLFPDPANEHVKWAYPDQSGAPVCDMPPIPEDRSKPPEPKVAWDGDGEVKNVPAGDTAPVGLTITAPDGSKWQKRCSPTPFGVLA